MNSLLKTLIIVCLYLIPLNADVEKLVILGSGPAGMTAAIFAGQASFTPLVIEGEEQSGQLFSIHKIENYPGFPEGIEGHELHKHMRQQAEVFGARFYSSIATQVDLNSSPFHLQLADGHTIECESLIIATGSSPKWFGLENEQALIGKGVSANALIDAPKFIGKEMVVLGGGDSAMEQALFLIDYASKITLIYKRASFFAADYLQERVIHHPKINILLETEMVDIQDANAECVIGITVQNTHTKNETEIPCEGIIIANGRQPNTHLFKEKLEMNKEGYLITKPDTTETDIPGVFVAGDIASSSYRKVITATASGCMAVRDAKRFFNTSLNVAGP